MNTTLPSQILKPSQDDEKFKQDYVVYSVEKKFLLLSSFLRKNVDKNVVVFLCCPLQLKFFSQLLSRFQVSVTTVDDKMEPAERQNVILKLNDTKGNILFCTENIRKEINFLVSDWIVQFDPPSDYNDYVAMLKDISSFKNYSGRALIFLQPEELGLLMCLKKDNVEFSEFPVTWSKVSNVQKEVEDIMKKDYFMYISAASAYKSFIRFYDSHSQKNIFYVKSLNFPKVALLYGLKVPPFVELGSTSKKLKRPAQEGDSHEETVQTKKSNTIKVKTFKKVKLGKSIKATTGKTLKFSNK